MNTFAVQCFHKNICTSLHPSKKTRASSENDRLIYCKIGFLKINLFLQGWIPVPFLGLTGKAKLAPFWIQVGYSPPLLFYGSICFVNVKLIVMFTFTKLLTI